MKSICFLIVFPLYIISVESVRNKPPPLTSRLADSLRQAAGNVASVTSNTVGWFTDAYKDTVLGYRMGALESCLVKSGFDSEQIIYHGQGDLRYKHLNRRWNLRKDRVFPPAFIFPESTTDVGKIVRCAFESKIAMIPNSGGQSQEAISWGNNQTCVLDFRRMAKVNVEGSGENAVIQVQPGALVGHINAHLWRNGGYGLPMTNALTTGLAGDAIGGGHGYFSSLYGLTVDNILELEAVDANGEIHKANPQKNIDLFWALRGVGPGYIGIVTGLKLKPFQASDITLTFAKIQYPLKEFVDAWKAFQNFHSWAEENDASISRGMYITKELAYLKDVLPVAPGITIELLHIQDPLRHPETNEAFLGAVSEIFANGQTTISNPNYFQFVSTTGYAPINFPKEISGEPGVTLSEKFRTGVIPEEKELYDYSSALDKEISFKRFLKAKSFFVNRLMSAEEISALSRALKDIPTDVWILVSAETGSVQTHNYNENSYAHRRSTFNINVRYEGTSAKKESTVGMTWLYKFWDAIKFLDSGETYQNCQDLEEEDHFRRNYLQNLGKLIDAKRKWDPTEYFRSELSLPTQSLRLLSKS